MSQAQARARISHSRLAIPVKHNKHPKVLFAGEATHHRLFQTAIGAYLSGRREADRLNADWELTPRYPLRGTGIHAGHVENHTVRVDNIPQRRPPIELHMHSSYT
ncbi:hypothetical protein COOONC_13436 [Cooperia oncophora]